MKNKQKLLVLIGVVAIALFGMSMVFGSQRNVAATAFDELWVAGDQAAADKYFATNYDGYYVGMGTKRGPGGVRDSYSAYHNAFTGLTYTVEHVVNKDKKTAIVWRATGKHTGKFFGIAPTNKLVEIQGVTVYEVSNGRIVAGGQYWHTPGLLNQLQQLPPQAMNVSQNAEEAAAHSTQGHELIGVQEALMQSGREYSAVQMSNLETVGNFVEEVCVEPVAAGQPLNLGEFFAQDFVDHTIFEQMQDGTPGKDSQAIAETMDTFDNIFPSKMFIDDMFAQGDFVVVQNSLDMTQQLEVFGVVPDSTKDSFLTQRVDVMRLENGKIVEHWSGDDMGIFYHLGFAEDD